VTSSRRQFLRNSALVGATAALSHSPLSASLARTATGAAHATLVAPGIHQPSTGREHLQGPIPSMNARGADIPWIAVTLPHCADGKNSNDPDVPYYRGVEGAAPVPKQPDSRCRVRCHSYGQIDDPVDLCYSLHIGRLQSSPILYGYQFDRSDRKDRAIRGRQAHSTLLLLIPAYYSFFSYPHPSSSESQWLAPASVSAECCSFRTIHARCGIPGVSREQGNLYGGVVRCPHPCS